MNDLSDTKIGYINDYIFRQNLEFYPNLKGITCKNNTLYYDDKDIPLTFDLRLLPGQVWNYSANDFLNAIKLNIKASVMNNFINFIEGYGRAV